MLACPSFCNDRCFIPDSAENCLEVLQLQFIFDGLVHKTVEVPQLLLAGVGQFWTRLSTCPSLCSALTSWLMSLLCR